MKDKRRYRVLTWDGNLEKFTPQPGIRSGPYTLWGLRRALRLLKGCGYDCGRRDIAVYVERTDKGYANEVRERFRRNAAEAFAAAAGGASVAYSANDEDNAADAGVDGA